MRPIRLTMKSCVSTALGVALVSLLALSAPARAGDDDVPLDTKIFRNIMSSLGLKSADDPQINYLVIPSDRSLPPPQTTDAAINNPAWPKDPDVARAKLQAAHERDRDVTAEMEHDSNPLRPDELTPGRKNSSRVRHVNAANPSVGGDGTERLRPSELGYKGGLFKKMFGGGDDQEAAKFTGEPPRTELTEPPPGYQTPSPDQPYGNAKAAPPKADNSYITRGEYKRNQ